MATCVLAWFEFRLLKGDFRVALLPRDRPMNATRAWADSIASRHPPLILDVLIHYQTE